MWIAVHLPLLPLEAVRPLWSDGQEEGGAVGRPYALLERARVALADAQAHALGVRRGFARSHALALAPNLECLNPDPARELRAFEAVALALCVYTPQVVLAGAHTILLDVTASLRLFGGLRALWHRLVATLDASGHRAVLSCAPTPWAAWLFAQAGVYGRRAPRVVKPIRLSPTLDGIPVMLLPAAAAHLDGLSQIGCDTLGAVRRLPRGGITRRFGRGLLDTLAQTYGEAPDPRQYFEPPAIFEARLELMARVEQAEALLFAVRRLLQQLVGWLTARHSGVSRFTLRLVHETARLGDPRASMLTIAWSTPARDLEHLVLMSREKLQRTELIAPVIELHLSADEVSDYEAPTDTLFPLEAGGEAGNEAMARLLERLVARLGAEKVREVALQADHRPESAMTRAPYAIGATSKTAQTAKAAKARRGAERRFAAQRAIEQEVALRRGASATSSINAATRGTGNTSKTPVSAAANVATRSAAHVPAPPPKKGMGPSTSSGKRRRLNGRLDGPHGLVMPLAPVSPRPIWLLPEPLKLATRQGLPYYRSMMQIVSGPECIEAGWWDGQGATRDYFVVSADDATLYWVYRERVASSEHDGPVWYLHGVFG
ncbi:protein ImuB [Pararobbsia alpina]